MKFLIFFAVAIASTAAQYKQAEYRPTYSRSGIQERYAKTLKNNFEISPDGIFRYAYETDNGINAEANGYPRVLPGIPPEVAETIQGSYSWTSPEGEYISIGYIADENGYRATGPAIPTPPPIPKAILRSLEYNKLKASQSQRRF